MIKNLSILFATTFAFAAAEESTTDPIATYPEFEGLIKPYGYSWEAHTAAT